MESQVVQIIVWRKRSPHSYGGWVELGRFGDEDEAEAFAAKQPNQETVCIKYEDLDVDPDAER